MSRFELVVSRLPGKIRRTGPNKCLAQCCAHDDPSPSLSIRETEDGRVLLHCFAGCSVESIVSALGLRLEDLFPPRELRPGYGTPRERRPFSAADLIDLAAFEAGVVCTVVADLMAGRRDADVDRLIEAASRLGNVAEAVHGRR